MIASFAGLMLGQVRRAFSPELDALPAIEADVAATAMAGALSWSLWNHLVADLGLSDDRAGAVMQHLVLGAPDLPRKWDQTCGAMLRA